VSRSTRVRVAWTILAFGVAAWLFLGGGQIGACLGPLGVTMVQCAKATGVVPGVGVGLPVVVLTSTIAASLVVPIPSAIRLPVLLGWILGGAAAGAAFLVLRQRTMEGYDSSGTWISIGRPLDGDALATAMLLGGLLGALAIRVALGARRARPGRPGGRGFVISAVAVSALVLASCSAQATPAGAPATGSGGPVASASVSPTPAASSGPTLDCGRITVDVCERAVAIVRAAHEGDVRGATTIVVDDDCASLPKGCGHRLPFDAIVAFIAGHDTTGWFAYEVTGPDASDPTAAGSQNLGVPDLIVRRLATPEPSVHIDTSPPDPVVDTWPIGPELPCDEANGCAELTRAGLAGFDARDPGHAPVVATSLHGEGALVDAQGRRVLFERSGGAFGVLVVLLGDGTTHAIGVGYPGISQTAMAFPWEVTIPMGGG
jgi:hypothetical protein